MFVLTAKLTKKKLAGMVLAAGGVLIIIILAVSAGGVSETAKQAGEVKNIKTTEDRIAYLTGLGYNVNKNPVSETEVIIPAEWNGEFESYNDMLGDAGFDLQKYKGKKIKKITFSLIDHPSGKDDVTVNLLCYKNTVIGGDVQSPSADGFMHGIDKIN